MNYYKKRIFKTLEVNLVNIQYIPNTYRSTENQWMTAYSSSKWSILYFFLENLQCISILFPVGHENLLSIWDTHCRFPFQPLEFTALDRTQWYSINWSIVVQFTKYEWTKINLLKRLTRKKRQSIHNLDLIFKSKWKIRIFVPLYLRGILYTIIVECASYVRYIYFEFQIIFHIV